MSRTMQQVSDSRMTERDLDMQMLALFDKMRVEDEDFRRSFVEELKAATGEDFRMNSLQDEEIKAQHKKVCERVAKLTKMRLDDEIDHETYAEMFSKLKDEAARLLLHLERRTAPASKFPTSRSKRSNFLKSFGRSGLEQITPSSVEFSKFSV